MAGGAGDQTQGPAHGRHMLYHLKNLLESHLVYICPFSFVCFGVILGNAQETICNAKD